MFVSGKIQTYCSMAESVALDFRCHWQIPCSCSVLYCCWRYCREFAAGGAGEWGSGLPRLCRYWLRFVVVLVWWLLWLLWQVLVQHDTGTRYNKDNPAHDQSIRWCSVLRCVLMYKFVQSSRPSIILVIPMHGSRCGPFTSWSHLPRQMDPMVWRTVVFWG